jgi:hypothetical protein
VPAIRDCPAHQSIRNANYIAKIPNGTTKIKDF